MGLNFNGTGIEKVNFNGVEVKKVVFNGTTVWEDSLFVESAKVFTFEGNACTGYVGDNNAPLILIPKSYSIDSDGNFIDGYDYQVTTVDKKSVAEPVSGFSEYTGSIVLDINITSIGDYAFFDCQSLKGVIITENVDASTSLTSIGEFAFFGCSSLKSIIIPNSVTSIGGGAFYGCSSLQSITIGDSVTSIGDDTFAGCSSLQSITIGDSVTSIGGYAFSGCSSLQSITIPNSVTTIGESAFGLCSSLQSITIGDSVTSIGSYAFSRCSSLQSITIPNSVTTIGESAFKYCNKLTEMTIEATTPPTLANVDAISTATTTIYIPAGTLEAYQTANIWKELDVQFVEKSEPTWHTVFQGSITSFQHQETTPKTYYMNFPGLKVGVPTLLTGELRKYPNQLISQLNQKQVPMTLYYQDKIQKIEIADENYLQLTLQRPTPTFLYGAPYFVITKIEQHY